MDKETVVQNEEAADSPLKQKATFKDKKIYLWIFILIVFFDQLSKYVVKGVFLPDEPYKVIKVIKGFFYLRYVENSGAVWGIFSNASATIVPKIITGLSVVALVFVFIYFLKIPSRCKCDLLSLSFIIGGAMGNIIDRIYQGYVVDFLDVFIKNYHWPTFNVADSFITVGVIFLLFSIWRGKCTQF
ncbi:MAG: signal peptidase II [bacterium]|nr:signal peptidase II [bacterium]